MSKPIDAAPPQKILAAYELADAQFDVVSAGHINQTWKVQANTAQGIKLFALQRLNPIFDPTLHLDIHALVPHLLQAGLQSPQLVPSKSDELFVKNDQEVWRLLTWIDGDSPLQSDSPERCAAAGLHLGRFHAALWQVEHDFNSKRAGVHDSKKHLLNLFTALQAHSEHDYFSKVFQLHKEISTLMQDIDLNSEYPEHLVHGDPKISNFVFAKNADEALCLVDLDTLGKMPLALELGDAFRSWANPMGEEPGAHFVLEHFAAGFSAYLQGLLSTPLQPAIKASELRPLPESVERICLELASRFAADTLNESYFGWDQQRFKRSAEHNLQRARAQLGLAQSIREQRSQMQEIVDENLQKWRLA